jgi:hypothetical protein
MRGVNAQWNPLAGLQFVQMEDQGVPRYFFSLNHLRESGDGEGIDLPDFDSAWAEAVRTCGEMLRNLDGSLNPDTPFVLSVSDDSGAVLGRLKISVEFPTR